MVTYEEDSLMAQYDIPPQVDTVDVCETWNGSDYAVRADIVGSSEYDLALPDSVHTVVYESGGITGYAADGGSVDAQGSNGPTAFDFMSADAATRQASYDAPYYGVASAGGGSTCVPNPGQACPLNAPSAPLSDGLYTKHGLKRRGVRALVDDLKEVGRGPDGARLFRTTHGTDEIILSVDPTTELLVGEEVRRKGRTLKTKHAWRRAADGYVRDRSEIEDVEEINGKKVRSVAIISFSNVVVQ